MDSPFHRSSSWQHPTRPRPTKVVTIPVHFVGSERKRTDSAVRIQKAFRGYLVRKSTREIAAIRAEVNAVEEKIGKGETAEWIRRDARERVKVSEMLMSLLIRLDSVRGVDSGIRELRRKVIKKAIALLEAVDCMASGPDNGVGSENLVVERSVEEEEREAAEGERHACAEGNDSNSKCDGGFSGEPNGVLSVPASEPEVAGTENEEVESEEAARGGPHTGCDSNCQGNDSNCSCVLLRKEIEVDIEHGATNEEGEETCSEGSKEDSSADPEGVVEGEKGEEALLEEKGDVVVEEEQEEENRERERQSREMLERMVEDNERMMGMMAELFQRNEMQTKLLSSLSQRVEQLERVFACERLRRKKKKAKRSDGGFGGCVVDSAQDCRKCGKR